MQINIEYNISYIYHSLYAFFDRDNIGLPGVGFCGMRCQFLAGIWSFSDLLYCPALIAGFRAMPGLAVPWKLAVLRMTACSKMSI